MDEAGVPRGDISVSIGSRIEVHNDLLIERGASVSRASGANIQVAAHWVNAGSGKDNGAQRIDGEAWEIVRDGESVFARSANIRSVRPRSAFVPRVSELPIRPLAKVIHGNLVVCENERTK